MSTPDRVALHTRVVSGSGDGHDKTNLNAPRVLKSRGYPMVCAYLRDPADTLFEQLELRAKKWQAPLVAVQERGALDWRVASRVNDLCAHHQPAIWHGHDYKPNLLGLIARRRHPLRLITTVHSWVKHISKTPL